MSTGPSPSDLDGVYLRNTENPLLESIRTYHPFDGDGMVHSLSFGGGEAVYHNRFVRTAGLTAELEAGRGAVGGVGRAPEPGQTARRLGCAHPHEGCIEHRRRGAQRRGADELLPVRRPLPARPGDPRDPRHRDLGRPLPGRGRIGAHQGRRAHRRAAVLQLLHRRAVHALRRRVAGQASSSTTSTCRCRGHGSPTTWPSPSTSPSSTPPSMFWDPEALRAGAYAPRFFADEPNRFAIVPRRGTTDEIRWFEAEPTYVLHWINAYEDGDEIVLDGFFQHNPSPAPPARRRSPDQPLPLPRPPRHGGRGSPVALRPAHRRHHRDAAVRSGDGVRDDQRPPRRAPPPLRLQRPARAGVVRVRRLREARRRDRPRRRDRAARTGCSPRRRSWPRERDRPPRTTGTC